MKKQFSISYLFNNSGCYRISETGKIKELLLGVKEPILLEQILNSEIPIKDKYWFVCKKLATKEQNQQISIGVAEIVLHLFENKYPEDKRPRKAIEAAKSYLAGNISFEDLRMARISARAAAYTAAADDAAYTTAADDAAYTTAAADAAYAAADAAYAAYATAAAAADAAYAAAYAAYATAADAAAAAADAAYAAADAAYATAADAADAAAAYAAAAADADYADYADLQNILLNYLINFCNESK